SMRRMTKAGQLPRYSARRISKILFTASFHGESMSPGDTGSPSRIAARPQTCQVLSSCGMESPLDWKTRKLRRCYCSRARQGPPQGAIESSASSSGLNMKQRALHKLFDLSGRVALVTGAGVGFGEAISLAFADYGCDVAACDLNLENPQRTAEQVLKK